MARRRKRGGRKGSKAIPIMQTATIGYPVMEAYTEQGLTKGFPVAAIQKLTGFNIQLGKLVEPSRPVLLVVTLLAESTIGSKLANRTGVNRLVKKATGGLLKLC